MAEGCSFEVLAEAAPMEFLMIFGSACGALVIGQDIAVLKGIGGGLGMIMSGPKWKKQDYQDLLALRIDAVADERVCTLWTLSG